jgi:hypothetical protein
MLITHRLRLNLAVSFKQGLKLMLTTSRYACTCVTSLKMAFRFWAFWFQIDVAVSVIAFRIYMTGITNGLLGLQVNAPDGGEFFVWDGCAACVGGVRIDFSVSGARNVEADACTVGVVPGVSWSVSSTQVKNFVA